MLLLLLLLLLVLTRSLFSGLSGWSVEPRGESASTPRPSPTASPAPTSPPPTGTGTTPASAQRGGTGTGTGTGTDGGGGGAMGGRLRAAANSVIEIQADTGQAAAREAGPSAALQAVEARWAEDMGKESPGGTVYGTPAAGAAPAEGVETPKASGGKRKMKKAGGGGGRRRASLKNNPALAAAAEGAAQPASRSTTVKRRASIVASDGRLPLNAGTLLSTSGEVGTADESTSKGHWILTHDRLARYASKRASLEGGEIGATMLLLLLLLLLVLLLLLLLVLSRCILSERCGAQSHARDAKGRKIRAAHLRPRPQRTHAGGCFRRCEDAATAAAAAAPVQLRLAAPVLLLLPLLLALTGAFL